MTLKSLFKVVKFVAKLGKKRGKVGVRDWTI